MIDEIKRKNPISSPIGLQIDNLVYNQHGEMVTIRPNDFHRFMQPRMNGDYGIYGIPVTAAILEKCGFTRNGDWLYKQYFILGYITSDDNFQAEYKFAGAEGGFKVLDIKYVHQLQNLYFALTGEELTYNPNQP